MDDAVIVVNWVKDGATPEEKASDREYGIQFVSMITQFGGGPTLMAHRPQPLRPVDGSFDKIALVHYPSRAFVGRLFRSQWMHATISGKKPSDTLAVFTTPLCV